MYMEDLDLSYRLAKEGWRSWYEPTATVMHVKGGTVSGERSPRLNWHFHRGMYLFYRHHYAPHHSAAFNALVYVGIAAKLASAVAQAAATPEPRPPAPAAPDRAPQRRWAPEHLGRWVGLGGPSRAQAVDPAAHRAEVAVHRRLDRGLADLTKEHGRKPARRDHAPFPQQIATTKARQIILAGRARAEGRGVLVRPARVLRQPAPATLAPEPQDEIDVLQVREDRLVEAPYREERLALEGGRRPGWADRVGDRTLEAAQGLAVQVVVGEQGPVELDAGRLYQSGRARVSHDARGHHHAAGRDRAHRPSPRRSRARRRCRR